MVLHLQWYCLPVSLKHKIKLASLSPFVQDFPTAARHTQNASLCVAEDQGPALKLSSATVISSHQPVSSAHLNLRNSLLLSIALFSPTSKVTRPAQSLLALCMQNFLLDRLSETYIQSVKLTTILNLKFLRKQDQL